MNPIITRNIQVLEPLFDGGGLGGGALGLPDFLPIKVNSMGVEWRDIQADPMDLVLTVSASVSGIQGLESAVISGAIEGLKIDNSMHRRSRFVQRISLLLVLTLI